jgi:O-antigen ligase
MNPIVSQKKAQPLFVFLLCILVLCIFLKPGFTLVTTIVIVLYSFLMFYQNGFRVAGFNKVILFPMSLYLTYFIWTLMSSNKAAAVLMLQTKAPLFVLPLCFILAGFALTDADRRRVMVTLLVVCILASLYCLAYATYSVIKFDSLVDPGNANQDYFFVYDFLTLPVGVDPIYFSMFCNLAVAFLLFGNHVQRKPLRLALVIYLCGFIILVASKMGIICMVLILLAWFVLAARTWMTIGIIALGLIAVAWIGLVKIPFLKERFKFNTEINYPETDDKKWGSAGFRLAIWSCAIQGIRESPILGYGTADGQAKLEEVYHERKFFRGFTDLYNPHNEFLSVALDLGIVGLVLVLAAIIIPTRGALADRDLLALCFSGIIFLNFLIECVLNRQKGIVFFSLFYCLFHALIRDSRARGHSQIKSFRPMDQQPI